MTMIKILNNRDEIDLTRHGVIEAHAGTGKTYTIVEMVLRILENPVKGVDGKFCFVHIREILLVTFTDKAAGELKRRIREGLEKRLEVLKSIRKEDLISHLENCLNNLHEALIGTIHSVSLRLLQTWPFETGVHFKTEIVDDSEGLSDALRESMRTDWQEQETRIPWALEQLQGQGIKLEEKHYTLVIDIAGKLLDKENTILDRGAVSGNTLKNFHREMEQLQLSLKNEKIFSSFFSAIESLITALRGVSNTGKLEPDRLQILHIRVSQLQEMCRTKKIDTRILKAPCKDGTKGIYTKEHQKKISGLEEIDILCDTISKHLYRTLSKQKEDLTGLLPLTLLFDAAELLCDRWLRKKEEKGLISYQDMLRKLYIAVHRNPLFCSLLRRRIRFGIIDEFQDTSIPQWEIFHKLFLEEPEDDGPRLFIVGDPKQSIYSFQGADVQSYLSAKSAIAKKNGQIYGLINNYRSLPETIMGYNTILASDGEGNDWFAFHESSEYAGRISYPGDGDDGKVAGPPERADAPLPFVGISINGKPVEPIQFMALEGNAASRRRDMAAYASQVIRSLAGKTISVPCGVNWNTITLEFRDFAVIVETHRLAEPFLERFQADGIPAMKYKMEGVFQSAMARDIHALLRALLHHTGDPAPRLALLLTHFFNRHPVEIDPDKDLEPCRNAGIECKQGAPCIYHALEEWTSLASMKRWPLLFRSVMDRTGIRERVIRLADGGRHLADLRQVTDYCMEKLYRDNLSLHQLVEHLGRLLEQEGSAGQDRNLYTLATDKSSVRVLTMHAAKGLEFPVVFVVTGGSKRPPKGPGTLTWINDNRKKYIVPYVKIDDTRKKDPESGASPEDTWLIQGKQERRRLLYVAMTRAQAMLFLPMHLQEIKNNPDEDLTPRLLALLEKNENLLFNPGNWESPRSIPRAQLDDHLDPLWELPEPDRQESGKISEDLKNLNLPGRISRQTSYSELSRRITEIRDFDLSEEDEEAELPAGTGKNVRESKLPGGKSTGDALHRALEEILRSEDIRTLLGEKNAYMTIETYLIRNKILEKFSDKTAREEAIREAVDYVNGALKSPLSLPGGGTVTIAGLERADRTMEMEFMLGVAPHWIHGYMDLVFRIKNSDAAHPWRYFVLDWKSDSLEQFDENSITSCIQERHYDLQAKIYCHALDRYLRGLLGEEYEPEKNLGGAVYVFLRSFQDRDLDGTKHTWVRKAEPEADAHFTRSQIKSV